ncbi:hypothetical protein C8J57DRAFT_663672 [Mycena rebaudengoi]|nr:hypothetical protein C8J57DRAFT_663672 [Mycena rebaudengoi]
MSSCSSTATETKTTVKTEESLLTTSSDSLKTGAPTTTTITTSACGPISLSDVGCVPTPTTITSTIPGVVETIQVPVILTETKTTTETITLFGPPQCPVSIPPPTHSVPVSIFTPPPFISTSQGITTLSDGSVSTIIQTTTVTPSGSTIPLPDPTRDTQANTDGSPSSTVKIAPIVGGVLGGFFILLGLGLIIWFIMKRRRRWDDIFDDGPDITMAAGKKRFSLDTDVQVEPKPYQYGLIGHSVSPTSGGITSPPRSPPPQDRSPQSSLHARQNTLTPLQLPSSASSPGPSATTISSRPSTAGSMRPLRDPATPPLSGHSHNHTTSSGSSTSVHVSPAVPTHWGHHSPSPSAGQEYFDRAGSPTSMQDFGRLQVANSRDSVAISPPTPSPLSGPAMLDGKGRNVRLGSGGPGVLVHTDGGPVPDDYRA